MSKISTDETLYELLRVSPRATIAEITNAYHAAKNAFSKDSLATYSLMPAEDTADILTQLESAYMILTNPDKRREYDRQLAQGGPLTSEAPLQSHPSTQPEKSDYQPSNHPKVETIQAKDTETSSSPIEINLCHIRESKGLSLTDVSRITKIPVRYLKAIEDYDVKALPAQVYIQGFLKNIAQLYRLDPKTTVSGFMEQLNKITGSSNP